MSLLHRFEVVVKDDERAFLTRDGRFVQLLEPGRFAAWDVGGRMKAEVVKVARTELATDRALLFVRTAPEMASKNIEIVRTGPGELAIVSLDGEPKVIMRPLMTRAFWKVLTNVEVERIDTTGDPRVAKRYMDKLDVASSANAGIVAHAVVEAYEAGLLFIDGVFVERLPTGRHAFWSVGRVVRIQKLDLRPQPLEVTAQEILTKDRVAVRVTLTAFWRIVDAQMAALATADIANTVYRLVQFAIREAVATRTLDDILSARDTIDQEVRGYVTSRVGALGIEIGDIGVKDVILPGEVRDLLNKVVEAERTAKANQIRRQEETAATRSLLNTARLMEDNPLLIRLKELEALEKLVEKVGRIDLHTGAGAGGFEALLTGLYRLREQGGSSDGAAAAKPADGKG